MKILMFTFSFPPVVGGAEVLSHRLAIYFHQAGHEVVVVTPYRIGAEQSDDQQPFVVRRISTHTPVSSPIWIKVRQKLVLILEIRKIIWQFQPDTLLATPWDPCGYLSWFLKSRNTPYYVMGLGTELLLLPHRKIERFIKKLLRLVAFKQSCGVIAISHFTKQKIVEFGVPATKIHVIRCGIDSHQIDPQSPQAHEVGSNPKILTVSRLVERKACDTVIRTLPLLIDRYPQLEYRIVGDGKDRARLEKLTSELGLADHVKFYGAVNEEQKSELYRSSDVFVMVTREYPNDFEGFGIVFLEAMARGIPVIGANSGGIPDAIENGVTGLLVPTDDPNNLAQAIYRLLSDVPLRQQFVQTAMQKLHDYYTWPKIAAEYVSVMSGSRADRQIDLLQD